MQDASRYISFLENFKVFSQNHSQQRIEASKAAFGKVLGGVEMAMRIDREQERLHTPDCNIFLVISRLIPDETRLHSPFLKDLLDIQGAHKQGDLFLRQFLIELDRKHFRVFVTLSGYFGLKKISFSMQQGLFRGLTCRR